MVMFGRHNHSIIEFPYPVIKEDEVSVTVDYHGKEKTFSRKQIHYFSEEEINFDKEVMKLAQRRNKDKSQFRCWMLEIDSYLEKAGFQWEVWAIDFPFRDAYEKGEDPKSIASIAVNSPLYEHRKDERRGYTKTSW